jgi:hypothetical protein
VYSFCKNIVIEYSNVQKRRPGKKHRMKKERKKEHLLYYEIMTDVFK